MGESVKCLFFFCFFFCLFVFVVVFGFFLLFLFCFVLFCFVRDDTFRSRNSEEILFEHYENTPIQIYRKFHLQNLKIFT